MLHFTMPERTISHHAMLDIFPSASLRGNILMKGQYHKEDGEICTYLVGNGDFESDFLTEDKTDQVVR